MPAIHSSVEKITKKKKGAKKTKISVTTKDIKKGVEGDGAFCPIARAIKRTFKGAGNVSVTSEIEFELQGITFNIPTPERAERFIEKFDDSEKVKSFSFNIPTPVVPVPKFKKGQVVTYKGYDGNTYKDYKGAGVVAGIIMPGTPDDEIEYRLNREDYLYESELKAV